MDTNSKIKPVASALYNGISRVHAGGLHGALAKGAFDNRRRLKAQYKAEAASKSQAKKKYSVDTAMKAIGRNPVQKMDSKLFNKVRPQ